ncbi:MAG: ATP-binding protein [Caulobacterales bacterium]
MEGTIPAAQSSLLEVMLARRDQFRLRVLLNVVVAVVFHSITGWLFALSWFAAWLSFQLVEQAVFRPDRAHRLTRSAPGRAATLMLLVVQQLMFGLYAIAQAPAGAWGMGCGLVMINAAIMNAVLSARRCRSAFLAMVLPFAVYFAAIPIVGGLRGWHLAVLLAGGVLNCVSATLIWLQFSRSMQAERTALLDSDARRAEAESAVAAKSAFVAVVSHELRTPISAILAGAAELERAGDGAARANARLIADAGAMMRSLLNDLLDRAKLDAGRLAVESVPFDLRGLLAGQMRFWRAEARRKGLTLIFRGAARTPNAVQGDPMRIRQVLNNLISNALKFTEAGSVHVTVASHDAPEGVSLEVSVADTGPGMTADQLTRLFTPFEQLEASIARNHGGTGLGLAISRDLTRLMGGDITVTSAPGAGATFTLSLTLPLAEAGATPEPAAQPTLAAERLAVLVVDDHEINRRAMDLILQPTGAQVTCAESAAEALDLLAERPFDVVLMDCYMPGMDGRAATRILRGAPGPNRTVPVIAVTASTTGEDIRECKAAGMNAHIAKPIDPAALHAALAAVLDDADAVGAAVA